jgi:hypothetical protein
MLGATCLLNFLSIFYLDATILRLPVLLLTWSPFWVMISSFHSFVIVSEYDIGAQDDKPQNCARYSYRSSHSQAVLRERTYAKYTVRRITSRAEVQ